MPKTFAIYNSDLSIFKWHLLHSMSNMTIVNYDKIETLSTWTEFQVRGTEKGLELFTSMWNEIMSSQRNFAHNENIQQAITLKDNLDKKRTPPWKQQAWGRSEQSPSVNVI